MYLNFMNGFKIFMNEKTLKAFELNEYFWELPSNSAVVVVGAAGVTGSGGLSQAVVGGDGTLLPRARPAARSRGDGSAQQRLLKSSRSIAHAVTPPIPWRNAHSTCSHS